MTGAPYAVEPATAFVDVPYSLAAAWTTGGYTWAELEAAGGIPAAVERRLTDAQYSWCLRVVRYWASLDAYRYATHARGVQPGHAWIGPTCDGWGVRYLTGAMDAPTTRRAGGRSRWKW